MKKEKTFTMKLGDYTTIAHEIEDGAYTPHIQKIMDEMTANIHKAMFIGLDFGSSDMTATAVTANGSVLTVEKLHQAINMLMQNAKFPVPPVDCGIIEPVKSKTEPKSEFKSWPYAIED